MNLGVCGGCGAALQQERPSAPGFVPPGLDMGAQKGLVCRRCYRIAHYGVDETPAPLQEGLRERLGRLLERSDWSVAVVDIVDFEGSFDPDLLARARGRLSVAVNKIDLMPARTPLSEVRAWVAARLAAAGVKARAHLISSAQREGVAALWREVALRVPQGGQVTIAGATNVGKSTLLAAWQDEGELPPTVSRFPGTTQGVLVRRLPGGVRLVDTPGLAPKGRLSDALCPECAIKLVPHKRLESRLIALGPGQAVAWGGFLVLQVLESHPSRPHEAPLLFFGSEEAPVERVRNGGDRAQAVLAAGGSKAYAPQVCKACAGRLLAGGTEEVRLEIGAFEDVAIHGLGWFSPRLQAAPGEIALKVAVTLPAGVQISVRPRLIGPKRAPRARRKPAGARK